MKHSSCRQPSQGAVLRNEQLQGAQRQMPDRQKDVKPDIKRKDTYHQQQREAVLSDHFRTLPAQGEAILRHKPIDVHTLRYSISTYNSVAGLFIRIHQSKYKSTTLKTLFQY
ncbi:hypothetical protein NDU88_004961 [Pleurodeles waltl]|uniref:Uncharacterized protein n=1 Tax=Pleurodeles waltl TaxID=8319 RepID=A0AAV7RIU7_PLEWA|nr:hypothetical protein NDU88_004961 [Pleurodeles waltl]